ncbi:NUDIX hydrolase [Mesobacillus subterraneus]|uniref:NUDIX hydrolase n=1 Tax=Mesobacillus subterraneus TaxID=285983 RepID=A0A3R9FFY1_9BACI|nr:NUDIX hydrolase [Mesobacillus subterraneus]RSD25482.1 NUDIX hydrolase [Mesobacillus subterraneus]
MKRVDVAYALILDECEKKVLMVNNVGSGWSLPGGEVEKGETLEEGVVREAMEETGLFIEPLYLSAVNERFRDDLDVHVVFFTFKVKILSGEIGIKDETEISEVMWIDFETANQLMPYYPNGVEALLKSGAPYHFQPIT